jgi:hypothetical protein
MRRHVARDHVADLKAEQCGRAAHLDDALRLGAGARDDFRRRLGLNQHRDAVAVVFVADLGHGETPRRALDEANAQPLFQRWHPAAEADLGSPRARAAGAKPPVVHHLDEEIEVVQVLHRCIVPRWNDPVKIDDYWRSRFICRSLPREGRTIRPGKGERP